jgi:uncharacterized protein YbjQ (UPF0145 family)
VITDPDGQAWTEEEVAAGSAAEIEAGRLPLRAQWRIAEQRERRDRGEPGSFTSDLTVEEFAAIRSVGFSPVGQVLGSAVYNIGGSYSCGYYAGYGYGAGARSNLAPAPVITAAAVQRLFNQARHRAVQRMRQECAGLGGDGVVGVRLAVQSFYGNGLEFMAIGTAVRADGPVHPRKPFTTDLTGQDFAKLLRAGWVPVALVQGVGATIRHDDLTARSLRRWSWSNWEIRSSTGLVHNARDAARESLAADARRRGGQTVILRDMVLEVFEQSCTVDGKDRLAVAALWGTAVVPFETSASTEALPLPMLRL